MQASNLILFNQKEAVRCCCFVCGSYVALASENLLYVFNLAEGKSVPKCRQEVDKEYSPIGLHLVSAHQNWPTIVMQGKHCKMSVYTIILSTDPLIRQIASYNIPPLGFTKVGYLENEFDNEKRLVKVLPKLMFTADMQRQTISLMAVLTGQTLSQCRAEDQEFDSITCLLAYHYQEKTHLLVAEEGCLLKKFVFVDQIPGTDFVSPDQQIIIPNAKEVKIILSMDFTDGLFCFVCTRDDRISLINLQTLGILSVLEAKPYRICKVIHNEAGQNTGIIALASKSQIAFWKEGVITKQQRIKSELILDICNCQSLGLIGVAEKTKLFFLP